MTVKIPQTSQSLEIWEKIEIIIGADDNLGRYVARVEDFTEEGIIISPPEFINGSIRLRDNIDVRGLIARDDAVYEFHSRIRKVTENGHSHYILSDTKNFRRVQRRQFVRIETLRDISIIPIKESIDSELVMPQRAWDDAVSVNISGGGMLLQTSFEIPKGTILLLKSRFFLETGMPITIAAVVRRCRGTKNCFHSGVEFIRADHLNSFFTHDEISQLPESIAQFDFQIQNRVVNYVFQQQVNLRQKGLL